MVENQYLCSHVTIQPHMKPTERIQEMEARFDGATAALRRLSKALDGFDEVQTDLDVLSNYYQSEDWKQDFAADEEGLLPPDLKRGVLSEDGIWNLLDEVREIRDRMKLFGEQYSRLN